RDAIRFHSPPVFLQNLNFDPSHFPRLECNSPPLLERTASPVSPVDIRAPGLILPPMTPRTLSHDEKKAAEAAFQGLPMDPSWTAAAKRVYEGLLKALPAERRPRPTGIESDEGAEPSADSAVPEPRDQGQATVRGQAATREEAIEAGALVDVSEQ